MKNSRSLVDNLNSHKKNEKLQTYIFFVFKLTNLVSGHCYKAASVQLTVHVPVSEHSQLLSDHERRVSNSFAVRPDDLTKVLLISIRAESCAIYSCLI